MLKKKEKKFMNKKEKEKIIILLNGITVTEPTRRADPYARLYFETWSKHRQGRTVANRYNTDKAESNPRASVGRRSANNIQQGKAEG